MRDNSHFSEAFLPLVFIFGAVLLFMLYNVYWTGYTAGACDVECREVEGPGFDGSIDVRGRCTCFGPGTVP
jgi:hypothetical protein